ncbi:nucleotide kinase [Synechococcus phage DSL-LC02]|nr:nucleotide kinase [Synechococcus phage DSL-LC02]
MKLTTPSNLDIIGEGNCAFPFTMENETFVLNLKMTENQNNFWKYEEDKTLKEIEQYLSSTYHSHYTSEQSKTQTLDLIQSIGDAEAFTRSNAIKYLSRFGKKNGKSKLDILKAIHYCILLYHFAGLHNETKGNYETF